VTPASYEPESITIDSQPVPAIEEFGYAQCKTCHGEFLAFSLDDNGECYYCAGTLPKENPK
jgi:hypothetical protein